MATRKIEVERFSIVSSRRLDDVVAAIDAAVGHPADFQRGMEAANTFAGMSAFVESGLGPTGFMEFARYGTFRMAAPIRLSQFSSTNARMASFLAP
jgi:hypothetical protein